MFLSNRYARIDDTKARTKTLYCPICSAFATAELGETASYRDICAWLPCAVTYLVTVRHVLVPMQRMLVCNGGGNGRSGFRFPGNVSVSESPSARHHRQHTHPDNPWFTYLIVIDVQDACLLRLIFVPSSLYVILFTHSLHFTPTFKQQASIHITILLSSSIMRSYKSLAALASPSPQHSQHILLLSSTLSLFDASTVSC